MVFAFPIEKGDRGINLLLLLSYFFAKRPKKDQGTITFAFWKLERILYTEKAMHRKFFDANSQTIDSLLQSIEDFFLLFLKSASICNALFKECL